MNVYLGKDRQRAAQHLTATHATVTNLKRGVEGFGHKLYMDNFISSPDLAQKKISCCGTVRLHSKGMPKDLKPKTLRLKRGDIRVRTRGDLTDVVWKDKRDVCLLTNIHDPPREGNYSDEHWNVIKPVIVTDYNCHMGHVDNADRMANSYKASRQTWKWTKNSFSTCWTWPLSTVTSFYLHVVGRKSHTEIFDSPLSERCWHILGMSHDHPCL